MLAASAYGVRTIDRIVRARQAGRAIVEEAERRQAEIVVLGAPRGRHRAIFGKTVDYVLKNAQCRVMVAAGKKSRADRALRRRVSTVLSLVMIGLGIAFLVRTAVRSAAARSGSSSASGSSRPAPGGSTLEAQPS